MVVEVPPFRPPDAALSTPIGPDIRPQSNSRDPNPTAQAKRAQKRAPAGSHPIELSKIYRLTPNNLESYFKAWETKWKRNKKDINNPKIPLSYVEKTGQLVYPITAKR
jgi:hypothetical protein